MRALIVQGGWAGHQPKQVSEVFTRLLRADGFEVDVRDTLDAFAELDLRSFELIVPVWTMGRISGQQLRPVMAAVAEGVGLAGCHGGMCDAFRDSPDWQFMTGGQWVSHPGGDGVEYTVHPIPGSSPIVEGVPDFPVKSEQYYMHIDPAIKVLATTRFPVAEGPHAANGPADVPVVWTKLWGKGRVFYNSLGHHADILDREPCPTIMARGFRWAADGARR